MFREILKNKIKTFNGHFGVGCQEASLTPVMQSFIPTFMHGSSAEITNEYYKHAALTVGQMIAFNTTIHTRKTSTILYHSVQREPPLPVYLMIMIYNKTRNSDLIKKLSHLGLCISKYRLSNISVSLGNALLSTNEKEGVMVPMNWKLGLFTTASLDNIDVQIKSSLSTTCLHGTAASLNQHPNHQNKGKCREQVGREIEKVLLCMLPDLYSDVPPFHLPNKVALLQNKDLPTAMEENKGWLKNKSNTLWAVHHACKQLNWTDVEADSAMLPIWRDDSKLPATIKQVLDIIMASTNCINLAHL